MNNFLLKWLEVMSTLLPTGNKDFGFKDGRVQDVRKAPSPSEKKKLTSDMVKVRTNRNNLKIQDIKKLQALLMSRDKENFNPDGSFTAKGKERNDQFNAMLALRRKHLLKTLWVYIFVFPFLLVAAALVAIGLIRLIDPALFDKIMGYLGIKTSDGSPTPPGTTPPGTTPPGTTPPGTTPGGTTPPGTTPGGTTPGDTEDESYLVDIILYMSAYTILFPFFYAASKKGAQKFLWARTDAVEHGFDYKTLVFPLSYIGLGCGLWYFLCNNVWVYGELSNPPDMSIQGGGYGYMIGITAVWVFLMRNVFTPYSKEPVSSDIPFELGRVGTEIELQPVQSEDILGPNLIGMMQLGKIDKDLVKAYTDTTDLRKEIIQIASDQTSLGNISNITKLPLGALGKNTEDLQEVKAKIKSIHDRTVKLTKDHDAHLVWFKENKDRAHPNHMKQAVEDLNGIREELVGLPSLLEETEVKQAGLISERGLIVTHHRRLAKQREEARKTARATSEKPWFHRVREGFKTRLKKMKGHEPTAAISDAASETIANELAEYVKEFKHPPENETPSHALHILANLHLLSNKGNWDKVIEVGNSRRKDLGLPPNPVEGERRKIKGVVRWLTKHQMDFGVTAKEYKSHQAAAMADISHALNSVYDSEEAIQKRLVDMKDYVEKAADGSWKFKHGIDKEAAEHKRRVNDILKLVGNSHTRSKAIFDQYHARGMAVIDPGYKREDSNEQRARIKEAIKRQEEVFADPTKERSGDLFKDLGASFGGLLNTEDQKTMMNSLHYYHTGIEAALENGNGSLLGDIQEQIRADMHNLVKHKTTLYISSAEKMDQMAESFARFDLRLDDPGLQEAFNSTLTPGDMDILRVKVVGKMKKNPRTNNKETMEKVEQWLKPKGEGGGGGLFENFTKYFSNTDSVVDDLMDSGESDANQFALDSLSEIARNKEQQVATNALIESIGGMASHADVTVNLIRTYSSLLGDEYSGMHNVFTSKRLCRYDEKGMAIMSTRQLVESQARQFTDEMTEVERVLSRGGDIAGHFKGKVASSGRIMFTHSKDAVKTAWENREEVAAAAKTIGKQNAKAYGISTGAGLIGRIGLVGLAMHQAHSNGATKVNISRDNANATNATPGGLAAAIEYMASSPTRDPSVAAMTPAHVLATHVFRGASIAGTDPSVYRALRNFDHADLATYQEVIDAQPSTPEHEEAIKKFRELRKNWLERGQFGGGFIGAFSGGVGFGVRVTTASKAMEVFNTIGPGIATRSGVPMQVMHAYKAQAGFLSGAKTALQGLQALDAASFACNGLVVEYLVTPAMTAALGEGREEMLANAALLCRMAVTAQTYSNPYTGTLGLIGKAATFLEFLVDGASGAYQLHYFNNEQAAIVSEQQMLEHALSREEMIVKMDTHIMETLMKSADPGSEIEALMADSDKHDMLQRAGISPVSDTIKALSGAIVNIRNATAKNIDIEPLVTKFEKGIEGALDIGEERIRELEPAEIGDVDDRLAVELEAKGLLKGHSYSAIKDRIYDAMEGNSELSKVYAVLEQDLTETDHLTLADARARLVGLSSLGHALLKDLHTATKEAKKQVDTDVVSIKGYVRVPLKDGGYEVWKASDLKYYYAVKHVEDTGMEIMQDLTEQVLGTRDQMVAFLMRVHDMPKHKAENIVNFTTEDMAHKLTDMASGVKRDARQVLETIEEGFEG